MHHVSMQGIDERVVNVHYYYYLKYNYTCQIFHLDDHYTRILALGLLPKSDRWV